jgi:hypothetical protein
MLAHYVVFLIISFWCSLVKKIFRVIIDTIVGFIETSKPLLMVIVSIVLIMAVVTGHKYYQYTKNDPPLL